MESFNDIATRVGIDKDVIRKRWDRLKRKGQNLGQIVDGTRVFTKEESSLLDYPLVDNSKKKEPITPDVQVLDGNHQSSVNIAVTDSVDLGMFRTNRESLSLDNSDQFLSSLDGVLTTIETHMTRIEDYYEGKFQDARKTREQAEVRINQVRQRASEHRIKTDLMAMFANSEIEQVEGIVDEFNAMTRSPKTQRDGVDSE